MLKEELIGGTNKKQHVLKSDNYLELKTTGMT